MKRTVVETCPFEREALVRKHYQNDLPFKMAYKNGTLSNFYETVGVYSKIVTNYVDEYEYKVPAKEVVTILKQGVADGIFDFSFSEKEKMRCAADILFHSQMDNSIFQDDELVKAAIKQNSSVFNILPEETKNKWYIYYLTCHPSNATDESNESILIEALEANPKIFEHIRKDNVTEKLLYMFLERCVKGLYKPTSYYWSNIPDTMKNKVYYQGKAMMNPYYLCEVPVEYQTVKLYDWICEHVGDGHRGYTEPLSVLRCIPDEYMTEEIALKCCTMHFHGVKDIPERFKNDDFYKKLIERGMYDFICVVDLKTISEELILECLTKMQRCQFTFWQEKFPKDFWTKEIVAAYAKVSNSFYTHVPKKLLTKENCLTNLKYHRSWDSLPKEYMDEEAIEIIMENPYRIFHKIPEEYKTREFYEKYIALRKIPFDCIPTECLTTDVLFSYIENDEHIPFEKIPQNMISKEIMTSLYMKNNKYHFSQENQNPQITEWLYEIYKEHEGINSMMFHLYQLPYLSEHILRELCEVFEPFVVAEHILSHYITQEMCDTLFEKSKDAIIAFPEKLRGKYRSYTEDTKKPEITENIESEVKTTEMKKNAEKACGELVETYVQLSLFDMLSIGA